MEEEGMMNENYGTRVPGGWIYMVQDPKGNSHAVFAPVGDLKADIIDAVKIYTRMADQFTGLPWPPFYRDGDDPTLALVSNRGLRNCWEALFGAGEPVPTHREMADALAALSGGDEPSEGTSPEGRHVWVYRVLVPGEGE